MLHDQDLPLFLWIEACNTAVYLQNRSPHKVVGSMTLEEAFMGSRLDVGRVRMFGCLMFFHAPLEMRTKLEPTAKKGDLCGLQRDFKDLSNLHFFILEDCSIERCPS
jgi:hypothetical protein